MTDIECLKTIIELGGACISPQALVVPCDACPLLHSTACDRKSYVKAFNEEDRYTYETAMNILMGKITKEDLVEFLI